MCRVNLMRYQRTVLAYHGCDQDAVRRVLDGEGLKPSANDYDWLGTGIYFWEQGPGRAIEWARLMKKWGKISKPAVLGAIINLGGCLDLLDVKTTRLLEEMYPIFEQFWVGSGRTLPRNEPRRKRHMLDCAFLNWAIPFLETENSMVYHTVRGVFIEGPSIYAAAQIHRESHIQLAVRQPAAIAGYFLPTRS